MQAAVSAAMKPAFGVSNTTLDIMHGQRLDGLTQSRDNVSFRPAKIQWDVKAEDLEEEEGSREEALLWSCKCEILSRTVFVLSGRNGIHVQIDSLRMPREHLSNSAVLRMSETGAKSAEFSL